MVVTPIHPRNMVVMPPRQQAAVGVDSGINLAYIYPVQGFWQQAMRFVSAYRQYPPLVGHRTVVIVNGPKAPDPLRTLFRALPMVRYFMHDNSGWDIGGYMHLARSVPPETVLFCCSTYCYFKKAGWLRRMNEVWHQNGPGLYGTIATYEVRPHFCTTGFMTTAGLLCKYQKPTNTKEERYAFEHGPEHFVTLCLNEGVPVRLVTWDGVYPIHEWRKAPNIYCRGNQSNCLTYFNHGETYERGDVRTRKSREAAADTLIVPMLTEKPKTIAPPPAPTPPPPPPRPVPKPTTEPRLAMVYIHVLTDPKFKDFAARFMDSYRHFPPDYPHSTVVVCNGGVPDDSVRLIFRGLPNLSLIPHDNTGWDIGGYQKAIPDLRTDAVLCLGSQTTFRRRGWMRRLVDVWNELGPGLYGSLSSLQYGVPHLATTGFICPPSLIAKYPAKVSTYEDRAAFEHGPDCLTVTAEKAGLPVRLVTWGGTYTRDQFRTPPNILNKGTQNNCLVYYTQSDIYQTANPEQKKVMEDRVNGV